MPTNARDYVRYLKQLHQVRQFLPTPVPQAALDDILETARWTGTAANRQHFQLIVVRDRAALQFLGDLGRPSGHLALAQAGIIITMSGDNEEWRIYDEGRVSERIMLAAHAHGLGAGIGWIVGDKVDAVKQRFGIPAEDRVRTAISLGYVDEAARKARPHNDQPRRPLADLVHWEHL
ncbi:MAG: nitroreductase family protein [Chloroflexota bacterium]